MQGSLFETIPCEVINGMEPIKLNIGCGNNRIEGYINIDSADDTNPDVVVDIRQGLPYPDNSAEEILFFHAIEHIEEKFHERILEEFWRVLRPEGLLLISYPEFEKCAQNYIENYRGMREFWKNTIYGLQRYPGDYHVALMNSDVLGEKLLETGFINIEWKAESLEPYNSIMKAEKGPAYRTYEQLLRDNMLDWQKAQ